MKYLILFIYFIIYEYILLLKTYNIFEPILICDNKIVLLIIIVLILFILILCIHLNIEKN